jgi:hypothetical protein
MLPKGGNLLLLGSLLTLSTCGSTDGQFSPPNRADIVVSLRERTYLTAEIENHSEGFLDPYQVLVIYYVKDAGTLKKAERHLVYELRGEQYARGQAAANVHFYRTGDQETDPIEVWLTGEQLFVFTPPAHFDANKEHANQ